MTDTKPAKKINKGNIFLFVGLAIFLTIFTIVSVMGNVASLNIDKPAGIIFIISSVLILIGLFL